MAVAQRRAVYDSVALSCRVVRYRHSTVCVWLSCRRSDCCCCCFARQFERARGIWVLDEAPPRCGSMEGESARYGCNWEKKGAISMRGKVGYAGYADGAPSA